jgi:hypothetical protein
MDDIVTNEEWVKFTGHYRYARHRLTKLLYLLEGTPVESKTALKVPKKEVHLTPDERDQARTLLEDFLDRMDRLYLENDRSRAMKEWHASKRGRKKKT